jgi:hypothetical protein
MPTYSRHGVFCKQPALVRNLLLFLCHIAILKLIELGLEGLSIVLTSVISGLFRNIWKLIKDMWFHVKMHCFDSFFFLQYWDLNSGPTPSATDPCLLSS